MSDRNGSGYEKPTVERFGTFRELTRLGHCESPYKWWTYGCNDDPKGGGRS